MDFTTRYEKLNAAQKQAVDTIDGPVMVIAGPGTGKTELLSMRVANILQKTDTLPENILCLTFTDSGANAMRERLSQIIGANAYRVAIHTFHSFGTEIINHNKEFFYHGADFRPADELSCYEILHTIFDGLEYNNPLAGKMNGEYTHLGDTLSVISELKKSGLTSDELLKILGINDRVIDAVEPLLAEIFSARTSKDTAGLLLPIAKQLQKHDAQIVFPGVVSLARVIADSLEIAANEAREANSTKPITAWKNAWLKKNDKGAFILKSRERQAKLHATCFVYAAYVSRMEAEQLYDFDDMIMQVVHSIEVHPELRFNLQEKFQYVMVDEFQDTNMAQMRILYNLTNNDASEGRPNVMVVGDDDQAIYSFQGADVGNINSFRETYQPKIVTLVDNYRSADVVLAQARSVITRGQNRLENLIPDLDKTLTPHRSNENSNVALVELATAHDERQWLADTIAASVASGTSPSSIAVLARRHHEIVALLPYFAKAGIKVNYERRDNVLELEVIKIVELVAQILVALFEKRHDDADSLLPQLLAHPAFGIPPLHVWKLSLSAQQNHQKWMEVMAVTPALQPLHSWLVTQSQTLAHTPLERMLDEILGAERAASPAANNQEAAFVSPLFTYFFSSEKLAQEPDLYLTYLEALRTIRAKLREYQPNDTPTLQSFLEFIRMHRRLGSTITSIRPPSDRIDDAVNLMTAHKSKGLEFDHVYIIGAIDSAWGERVRARPRLISYPENLPLAPAGDTLDERLRLFFVAMTRARSTLTISYSESNDTGKSTLRASFLTGENWQPQPTHLPSTIGTITQVLETIWYQPLVDPLQQTMKELLAPRLENYKLSSTHLSNFLDVSRGGPQKFLLNDLLKFPRAKLPSASYGTAIHVALQRAHAHLSATGKPRPTEDILHDFEESLASQYLSEKDFRAYLQKGSDALSAFLEAKHASFSPTQKTELNFANQHAYLGKACLTGSLDLVDIDKEAKTIAVTDYKTGKASRDWNGKTDYEKIKLHRYKQQLMFYQLLVRHSRDYGAYTFEKGILQFVEPTPTGEIIALEAYFSPDDLDRFGLLIQRVWQRIVTLDLPDSSGFEPSYKGILEFESHLLDD